MTSKGLTRRSSAAVSAAQLAEPAERGAAGNRAPPTLCCFECYNYKSELLEYDYSHENPSHPQPLPRIRERGEYYVDSYNDQPWSWTFGTHESVRD